MAGRKKGGRMIAEIQRLKSMGLGKRAIARTLKISRNTLRKYWDPVPEKASGEDRRTYRPEWSEQIDWSSVKQAVENGQALAHYWEDFIAALPAEDPLRQIPYITFWREFRRRFPTAPLRFGQDFEPGSCCEIDYKGSRPGFGFTDPITQQFVPCELFGAMLRFSRFLSVDASLTQKKEDFLRSIDQAYRDFGGVPTLSVTDNLKPAVTTASLTGDADLNPDYTLFCRHYGTVAIPTRSGEATEKDGIEKEMHLFWRWFRPRLTKQSFSSLASLRSFMREASIEYNLRVQRRVGESRRQRLDVERAVMGPVPETPYEICGWKRVRPHPDCHVQVLKNFYSVPHTLRGKTLEARILTSSIEIFEGLDRVAVHALLPSNIQGRYQTHMSHLPPGNVFLLEDLPRLLQGKAQKAGPHTLDLVTRLFSIGNHPLRFLRRVQGILGLLKEVQAPELEAAIETTGRLGDLFPRPTDLLEIIRNTRSQVEAPPPVIRQPNRFLRNPTSAAPAPAPRYPEKEEEKCEE